MDPQTEPQLLFSHTRLPLTPFNVSKALHYNVQQMSCRGYWHTDTTSCLQPSLVIHMHFLITWMLQKSLRKNEYSLRCLCVNAASYWSTFSLSFSSPFSTLWCLWKGSKRTWLSIMHSSVTAPQGNNKTTAIPLSEQAHCCLLYADILGNVFRCLLPSHGMQACLPEASGKRQRLVFVL